MVSTRPRVYRVTGIPARKSVSGQTFSRSYAEAQALLTEAIVKEFQPQEIGQITPRIQIVPSCIPNDTLIALVDFKGGEPTFLAQLLNKPLSVWQIEIEIDNDLTDITFDCHFHGFTQLYATPTNESVTADIIAITGLDGHAYGSWRSQGNLGRMWLRDYLSKDMPRCRSMIYGYNSKLTSRGIDSLTDYSRHFRESIRTIRNTDELNRRPLFFVAHSFGGLILAHALIQARLNSNGNHPELTALSKATYGILFLGTPHKGLWIEDMLSMFNMIDPNHPRRELVEQLSGNSRALQEQTADFKNICHEYKIVSFYETQQTKRLKWNEASQSLERTGDYILSVNKDSALLQLPDSMEEKVDVDADHSAIAKFHDRGKEPYVTALRYLRAFEAEAMEVVSHRYKNGSIKDNKEACLSTLGFPDLFSREKHIDHAHPTTGDWLFATDEFKRWQSHRGLEEFNGVFWIKGKPGAGKSTLMKHMLLHLQKSEKYLIATHFFNARGGALEKSPRGMLRSLVYQLLKLEGSEQLWRPFSGIYQEKLRLSRGEDIEWPEFELKDFLLRHLPSCELSNPLLILVDALDECDEKEVRNMVEFLEQLSRKARHGSASLKLRLRIGLSSRHYPEISMQCRIELVLENCHGHDGDIQTYIVDNLHTSDNEIRSAVVERSSRIFMWVVLVVKLLNEAYDCGQVQLMRKRLEEVPADLEDLFEQILMKDNRNIDATLLTLQWVLFSRDTPQELLRRIQPPRLYWSLRPLQLRQLYYLSRPLQARELYFAVLSGVEPSLLGVKIDGEQKLYHSTRVL